MDIWRYQCDVWKIWCLNIPIVLFWSLQLLFEYTRQNCSLSLNVGWAVLVGYPLGKNWLHTVADTNVANNLFSWHKHDKVGTKIILIGMFGVKMETWNSNGRKDQRTFWRFLINLPKNILKLIKTTSELQLSYLLRED